MPFVNRNRLVLALCLLALGLAADQILHHPAGIGWFLLALAGTAVLVLFARPRPWSLALIGAGLALTTVAFLRASPPLIALNLMAAGGLAMLGASFALGGEPVRTGARAYVIRGLRATGAVPDGVMTFAPRVQLSNVRGAARLARTSALVLVVLTVFGMLLASADPVFAQTITAPLRIDLPFPQLMQHTVVTVLAAIAAGTLVAYARREQAALPEGSVKMPMSLEPWEWTAVLGAVVALFAAFVLFQFPNLFGGHQTVLEEIGLTYSEYARSGFAQMVVATILTLALIGFAWFAGAGSNIRFRVVAGALVALDIVVLVSAFQRLAVYEEAFGFTHLRLFGHVLIIWLAVMLVCVIVSLAVANGRWLPFAAIALAVVALVGLNIVNPDAFIVERNVERAATGEHPLDARYLASLSADAAPALVASLDEVSPDDLARLQKQGALTASESCYVDDDPWISFNLARERAASAVASYCS
ncbi:MAG: DUF4173 domain-containing protein [Actinomycetota bacterium]